MKIIKINDDGTLKTSEIIAQMKKQFGVWCYLSDAELDKQFPPTPSNRSFLATQEPQQLGQSAEEGDPKQEGITLRERLFLELAYFTETGEHLDVTGYTICSGSRDSDGGVPGVYWSADYRGVGVRWYDVGRRGATNGLRQAVLPSEPSSLLPLDLEARVKSLEEFKSKVEAVLKI